MKRALVLGGSGALGGATRRALEAEGARVAWTYLRGEAPGDGLALRMDARDPAEVEGAVAAAVAELGGLDALVHCAATSGGPHRPLLELTAADWDEVLGVNARSAFLAVKAAAPHLRASRGSVVLVGSVDAVKPVAAPAHYVASKGALHAMTMALAKELGPDGVRVNLVAPGVLEAGLSRDLPERLRAEYRKHCALGRPGTLDEAANLIAWLALHDTYVTAQRLVLDGGL
ncbi:MAG: SDR family oxidoreductase [Planctomycetota bacterium]|nr:SDR family oxidoreductase [Planctomycetota bacterium]